MSIRAIAIDDDPVSILTVKKLSETISELDLVNSYQDSIAGAAGIILDRPELILLDVEMPEFNGLEIMSSLAKPPKIVVISSNPDFKNKAIALNAVAFIQKPLTESSLRDALKMVKEEIALG